MYNQPPPNMYGGGGGGGQQRGPAPPYGGPVYGGGVPQYQVPPSLPPMPDPSHPSYPAWYKQWYDLYGRNSQQYNPSAPPPTAAAPPSGPPPQFSSAPPPFSAPPYGSGPPPSFPPPAKKQCLDLSAPPPPPPSAPPVVQPTWQAAKKGAVIYTTPRPPTPEPPKPPKPPSPPPPPKAKMQWFYDGQSWVYADKQPEMKEEPKKEEFDYSFAKNENPVEQAVLNNIRGRYNKRDMVDKPKATPVRCEVCSLTVTCEVTYQTHINGRPHKKRLVQMEKLKKEEEKKEAARLAQVEIAKKKAEAALEGKSIKDIPAPEVPAAAAVQVKEDEDFLESQPNGDLLCTLCSARMNSRECATAHINGKNHKRNFTMMQKRGGFAGRGGMRGGPSNRGGRGQTFSKPVANPVADRQKKQELNEQARAEFDKVLKQSLAANVDSQIAEKAALDAMNAVLAGKSQAVKTEASEELNAAEEEEEDDDSTWPPKGITVLVEPKGFKPGTYRCEHCEVNLMSEPFLEAHLNSPGHKEKKQNPLPSVSARLPARPRIHFSRRGSNVLKAQRGRRGLIAGGEFIPDSLTKTERREQRDIASSIQKHLEKQTGETKVLPLLMNFVRGEVIQPNK